MVSVVLVLAGMMAIVRFGGFALVRVELPDRAERSFSLVLIAALSALLATSTANIDRQGAALPALLLAALCIRFWRRLWLALVIGMAAFMLIERLLHEGVHQ